MKSYLLTGALAGCLFAAQPLFAQSSSGATDTDGSTAHRLAAVPVGATGVFVGVTVGVPVGIAGKIYSESRRMVGTLRSDLGVDFVGTMMALSMGVPYGIASGTILGSIRGVSTGVKYGYTKPFSKESMGLVEPEDE